VTVTPPLKHTVHTDALDTLGSVISADEKRDAIHLAVYPAEAGEALIPGDHVILGKDGKARSAPERGNGVGIVDPFLIKMVKAGERFWLVVYPRQITSLRHVWEHSAFPRSGDGESDSERWLRQFIDDQGFHSYDDDEDATFHQVVDAALRSATYGSVVLPFDANGTIPSDFWYHIERYTGTTIPVEGRSEYFSCAC
jgi:hypothetical protein